MVSRYLINGAALSVFVSRDAGVTWKKVGDGGHTYEIGNLGALLLMIPNDKATNTMSLSLDEGNTWENCAFTDPTTAIEAQEIVSDPDMQSRVFLAYGSRGGNGVLVSVDFSGVHTRNCTGQDKPDTPDSDYETWEPTDPYSVNSCLLGRKTTYVRRKQNKECLNPALTSKDVTVLKNCSCGTENYECDYCFVWQNGECVRDSSLNCIDFDPKQPPSPCTGTYA